MFHADSFSDFFRKSCEHLFTPERIARQLYKKGIAASRKTAKRQKTSIDYPVDFVVTWVDSSDPEWQSEKENYFGQLTPGEKITIAVVGTENGIYSVTGFVQSKNTRRGCAMCG